MKKRKTVAKSTKKSKLPLYLSLLFLTVLGICYFTIPAIQTFFNEAWNVLTSNDEARTKAWVEGFGWLGPIVIVVAMVVQMFLLVIPTTLLMIVTILAYGPIWGSLIVVIAIVAASIVGYATGKYVAPEMIVKLLGRKTLIKGTSFLENYGFWAVIITRINPFLSDDAISFVAGILKMGFLKFISATLLGVAPLIILIALLGNNIDSLKNGLLWGSLASLIVFGIYVWWDKKRKKT